MLKKITIIIHLTGWLFFTETSFAESVRSPVSSRSGSLQSADALIQLQEAAIKYARQINENPDNFRAIYNLAVINFRLQKYSDAEALFTRLLKVDSYHLVAKYNLGLVSYKQGKTEQAIQWFLKIIEHHIAETKTDKKLQQMAEIQLQKLSAAQRIARPSKPAHNQLKTYLFAKAGHDDHVEDNIGNIYTSDSFIKLYALMTYKMDAFYQGLETRFSVYDKSYDQFSDLDYRLITIDVGQHFRQRKADYLLRLEYGQSDYGATDFLTTTNLEAKAVYKFDTNQKLSLSLLLDDHSSNDPLYDVYEGSQQRLRLQYDHSMKPHKFRVRLELEDNDRRDDVNAGVVNRSYSPQRQKLLLRWFYIASKRWDGYLQLEVRDSKYNDFSVADTVLREESRQRARLQARYKIDQHWWWQTELEYTDNQSNIPEYDASRTQISTGIVAFF